MTDFQKLSNLRLSAQKSLLGMITPSVRGVAINLIGADNFFLYFYYDGEVTEEDKNSAKRVIAKMLAECPWCRQKPDLQIFRLDFPKKIPAHPKDTWFVYMRSE